jgi:hypothetical protein
MNIQELMHIRHDATPLPIPSEAVALDAEKIVQWLLEYAFFKPFVYRNPRKDPKKEFADALVVFDDTIVIVQVKAKSSERPDLEWVAKHVNKASKQLNGSFRQIKDRLVTHFTNPVFAVEKEIELAQYPYVYGFILLAGVDGIVDPLPLIETGNKPAIPTIFLSLTDYYVLAERVNTAADFIQYCEARSKLTIQESVPINQENNTLARIAVQVPLLLSEGRPVESFSEIHLLGFQWFSRLLLGEVNRDDDYQYSLLVDNIISHVHDLDPEYSGPLSESSLNSLKIGEQLGWLDRKRRIELGKLLFRFADASRDGNTRFLPYLRPKLGVLFLFMYTAEERIARQEHLFAYIGLAQVKYGVTRVLGIATEPIGNGRSYDMCWVEEQLLKPEATVPGDVLDALPKLNRILIRE